MKEKTPKTTHLPRRSMLQLGLTATAGILGTAIGCKDGGAETAQSNATPAACNVTPDQTPGPFYPHVKNGDGDVDLTTIQGKEGRAEGEIIFVRGRILDDQCQPIPNALVEIWQANHHGRYSHEGDAENPRPLDPNFEGWGEMTVDATGSYGFKTIKPAAYPFGDPEKPENWRTPHIHFKVSRRGYHELISQMYFEGEELNSTDIVLAEFPEEERGQFILMPDQGEQGIPVFKFDLHLKKVATAEERLAALQACAGTFELKEEWNGIKALTLRLDGNQLYIDLANYATVELKPVAKDEFIALGIYSRFVFNRNDDGSVNSLTLHNTSKLENLQPVVAAKVG